MVEANPVKFYVAKYCFLVIALVLWTVGALLLLFGEITLPYIILDVLFFILGLVLIYLFSIVSNKIKRVAIGEKKFVVQEEDFNVRFEWPEVKSLEIVPVINLCKVKVRGKKDAFYFFSSGNIQSVLSFIGKHSTLMKGRKSKRKNTSA